MCDFTCLRFAFELIGQWHALFIVLLSVSLFSFAFHHLQDKTML